MKKALGLLLLILLAACTTQVVDDDDGGRTVVGERTVVNERVIAEGDGKVVAAVTGDAAQDVLVTVDNIELYSAEDGWVTIAGDEDTYDLNSIGGQLRFAGEQQIDAGTYTQLRLDVSSATVNGQNAQVPAEKFTVPLSLNVATGDTVVVAAYIHGDESVSMSNGRYVFSPIITVNYCVDGTAMVNGQYVTTTCQTQPVVETYQQDVVTGRVIVNTVVREVPVIRVVERTEITNNNTTVINNTVIRERETGNTTGNSTNTTTNTSGSAGFRTAGSTA